MNSKTHNNQYFPEGRSYCMALQGKWRRNESLSKRSTRRTHWRRRPDLHSNSTTIPRSRRHARALALRSQLACGSARSYTAILMRQRTHSRCEDTSLIGQGLNKAETRMDCTSLCPSGKHHTPHFKGGWKSFFNNLSLLNCLQDWACRVGWLRLHAILACVLSSYMVLIFFLSYRNDPNQYTCTWLVWTK